MLNETWTFDLCIGIMITPITLPVCNESDMHDLQF